jgi:hypothetical protein
LHRGGADGIGRSDAWPARDTFLRPVLSQLFDGVLPIDTFMIAEISASAPLLVQITREVPDPVWTVLSGMQPLQFIAIVH